MIITEIQPKKFIEIGVTQEAKIYENNTNSFNAQIICLSASKALVYSPYTELKLNKIYTILFKFKDVYYRLLFRAIKKDVNKQNYTIVFYFSDKIEQRLQNSPDNKKFFYGTQQKLNEDIIQEYNFIKF